MSEWTKPFTGARRLLLAAAVSVGLLGAASEASAEAANAACPTPVSSVPG